jgi:hypothetical protein
MRPASAAAALSYGALVITMFRGYSQFGFMGGLGMGLCWLSTYVWLPPLGRVLDERWPIRPLSESRGPSWAASRVDSALGRLSAFCASHPSLMLAASFVASAIALAVIWPLASDPYEHDTTKLRSRWGRDPNADIAVAKKSVIGRALAAPALPATHRS